MNRIYRLANIAFQHNPRLFLRVYYYYIRYFSTVKTLSKAILYTSMSVPYASQRRYNWSWSPFGGGKKTVARKRARRRKKRSTTFSSRVKRVMDSQIEKKFIGTAFAADSGAIAGTSVVYYLSGTQQGDDVTERLGNEIRISKVRIEGSVSSDATAVADTQYRMVLLKAITNIEGVMPTVLELFDTDSPDSLRNLIGLRNRDFSILWDNKFIIREYRPPVAGRISRKNINYVHTFANGGLKVTFDAQTAGVADAEKNHLFLILMTNQANTFQPSFNGTIRITFRD